MLRVVATIFAVGVATGLQFGLSAPSYVAILAGVSTYFVMRFGRTVHQNLSWKLGYWRGKDGRPWSEPWWVDRAVYGAAFMQGKGVNLGHSSDKQKTPYYGAAGEG